MEDIRRDHPLRVLFAGLVENAFCTKVGMCNPALTEYLADLLVNFIHVDRLHAMQNAQGKGLEQIAAMMSVLSEDRENSDTDRDRTVYRDIGDYTLFWAGVYPEQLRVGKQRRPDVLLDYVSRGKRCYAIVSELAGENDKPPSSMFRHLSDDFEHCLYGLGLVRNCWEERLSNLKTSGDDLVY